MSQTASARTLVFLLVALLLVAGTAAAASVSKHGLSNGVTVLTMPADWNRIVAISVMVDAGSKHDPPKLRGLAHLTNAMLSEGTTTMGATALAEFADSHGIKLGTEVTEDYSQIYVTCTDSQLDVALDLVTDVLQHPAFDEGRLLNRQRVALDMLDERQRDALYGAFTRAGEAVYGEHPYAYPVEGTTKGIDRITPDALKKFHSSRYVGESTYIAVVGNFSESHVLDSLGDLLADYPAREAPETVFPKLPEPPAEPIEIFRDVDEAQVVLGFRFPKADDPDYAALRVMTTMLGEGGGSMLYNALVDADEPAATKTGAFCNCRVESGLLIVFASTDDPELAIGRIHEQFDRLETEPASDRELTRARNSLVGARLIRGQTNIVRAARLASYELFGLGADFEGTFLRAVNRVDKDDLTLVASKWLKRPVTVIVRPGRSARPSDREIRKRAGI